MQIRAWMAGIIAVVVTIGLDLVSRRDVELDPRGQLGFGRDIAAC